ncbi:LysR family transcriptional regulator [uncultured Dialister sp.]|uniref:LysR family transcriptional regulator n=1 Tax=uncultured Dialister sp. TaxID=278064 RepID=UPI00345B5C3E
MTKDDIQAFSAVASLRSYTKAAALLFVTESSLSKKITRLEREVGVQLLDRSRHGVASLRRGGYSWRKAGGSWGKWTGSFRTCGQRRRMCGCPSTWR